MKNKIFLTAVLAASLSLAVTGCQTKTASSADTQAQTTQAAIVIEETTEAPSSVKEERFEWETIAENEIDSAIYKMTGGTWFYTGVEDEKSIDMDGLKGFTTYTAEAIPETDGYLRYLGIDPDGFHVFDVYDLYGRQCMVLTFTSDEQFYIDGDENNYYIKWDY